MRCRRQRQRSSREGKIAPGQRQEFLVTGARGMVAAVEDRLHQEGDMEQGTVFGRSVGRLMAGLVVSGATAAGASVDMTATWRVEATVGPINVVTHETVVQTGTT